MSPFGVYVVTKVVCILSPRQDDFNSIALSVFIPEQQATKNSKIILMFQKNVRIFSCDNGQFLLTYRLYLWSKKMHLLSIQ